MNPQLIIPMSGIGKRFQDEGYVEPKFLIKVLGKTIIQHVIQMFPTIEDIVFIVNKEHCSNPSFRLKEHLREIAPSSKIFEIDGHNKGPGWAILEASSLIDLERPIIVNYCDFNAIFDYEKLEKELASGIDGVIMTYDGFHPHMIRSQQFAYVKKNIYNEVIEIQEKKPFTNNPLLEEASTGTYGFRNGKILLDALNDQVKLNYDLNGEYYISLTYKAMLRKNLRIKTSKVKFFMQWGTPQDLSDFNYWSDTLNSLMQKFNTEKFDSKTNKIILAAGRGNRFRNAGYVDSKALLDLNGKPIIERIIQIFGITQCTILLRRSQTDLINFLKTINAKLKLIENETQGQAASAYLGLQNLENQKLLISTCDSILIINELDDLSDKEIDLYVFTTKLMPYSELKPEQYGWVNFDKVTNSISKIVLKAKPDNYNNWQVFSGSIMVNSSDRLSRLLEELLNSDVKVDGEFYLDSVIEVAIKSGLRVIRKEADLFISLGTPDEYQSFIYWQSCFDDWESHPYSARGARLFN